MIYAIAFLAFGVGYFVGRETNSQRWKRELLAGLARENAHEREAARMTARVLELLRMS